VARAVRMAAKPSTENELQKHAAHRIWCAARVWWLRAGTGAGGLPPPPAPPPPGGRAVGGENCTTSKSYGRWPRAGDELVNAPTRTLPADEASRPTAGNSPCCHRPLQPRLATFAGKEHSLSECPRRVNLQTIQPSTMSAHMPFKLDSVLGRRAPRCSHDVVVGWWRSCEHHVTRTFSRIAHTHRIQSYPAWLGKRVAGERRSYRRLKAPDHEGSRRGGSATATQSKKYAKRRKSVETMPVDVVSQAHHRLVGPWTMACKVERPKNPPFCSVCDGITILG
jgi:hypothetical protein